MVKIGIDLRPLQSESRFRGIGGVLIQITNQLLSHFDVAKNDIEVVFYQEANDKFQQPSELLTIPAGLKVTNFIVAESRTADGAIAKSKKYLSKVDQLDTDSLDLFIQFDFKFGVPTRTKTVLIEHDLVLPIFWQLYYPRFIAKLPLAFLFNNPLISSLFKRLYTINRRKSVNAATKIVAISNTTKRDLENILHVPANKIEVIYHGIEEINTEANGKLVNFPTKPFLFFIGGTDGRREVDQLVKAFDQLKANGYDIQLALAGAHFKDINSINEPKLMTAIENSPYRADILLLGFVDAYTKAKLYEQTQAFVFPTLYEGFGLPILEAMQRGSLVVAYDNSVIREIGAEHVIYTQSGEELYATLSAVLTMDVIERENRLASAKAYSAGFTWDKAGQQYFNLIEEVINDGTKD
ncbi:MAG: glycosyltransferase family 4 protein [Lactobacillaceae bacterium]|jgi:glycosyltransferase involved in cell wall biosynthesis|nr:glycosyltransferase family 4 protein [Lactobacillaceae bacterium]